MPTITYNSIDEVHEDFRSEAKEVEGGEGKVTVNLTLNSRVDEFRNNNNTLAQERDLLKTANDRLGSIVGEDYEKFEQDLTELKTTSQRVIDGELTESTSIEEELTKRTTEMRKSYEDMASKSAKDAAGWREVAAAKQVELDNTVIDSAIRDAVLNDNSGARPDALPDITARGRLVFRYEEGKVIAKNGDATVYGASGSDPLTPSEWVAGDLKTNAPFYFKDSSGGGANGGDTLAGGSTAADLANMTPSQRLQYANMHLQKN